MQVTALHKHLSSSKRLHSFWPLGRQWLCKKNYFVCKVIWNKYDSLSCSSVIPYLFSLKAHLVNMKYIACNLCQTTSRSLPKNLRDWLTDVLEQRTPIAIWRLDIFENPGHSPKKQKLEKRYYHSCSTQRLQGGRKSRAWVIKSASVSKQLN